MKTAILSIANVHGVVIALQKNAVNIDAIAERLFGIAGQSDRAGMPGSLHCVGRSRARGRRIGGTVAILAVGLISGSCSRDDALEHLRKEVPVDTIEIVHARFPCRSPDLHFFGYRIGVILQQTE